MSRIIDELIEREGGYVNHPSDRGGPTKYGITQKTLAAWRGHPVTAEDVQNLSEDEARQIYTTEYVSKPGFDKVQDPLLRELLIDCGVNHGPGRAVGWLQLAVGATSDGVMGPKSWAAMAEVPARQIYKHVLAARIVFYGRIVNKRRSQADFIEGWNRRAAEFLEMLD